VLKLKAAFVLLFLLSNGSQPVPAAGLAAGELARLRTLAEEDPEHLVGAVLGLYYEAGDNVPQDYVEAARWYRLCADPGYYQCQLHLGMLYSRGRGVPHDLILAHMWLNLAAAQGTRLARELRDRTAESMSPPQIVQAQKLAREWKPAK
jgi:TPR repeat protein